MKIKLFVCVLTLLFIISVGIVTVVKIKEFKAQATVNNTDTEISEVYILKETDGILGVYNDNNELLYQYELDVNSLPETDIEILKKGLVLNGINELRSAIEDYTS